jgi:hypothetical protein
MKMESNVQRKCYGEIKYKFTQIIWIQKHMMALCISSSFLSQNDDSALTILQTCIPTTTTSTGLQAYNDHHSSLIDVTAHQAFSATTVKTIATMTQVPATTTAITKTTLLKLDKFFLHPAKMMANNAITKSLLLPRDYECTIIMTNLLLPLRQDNSAIR